MRIPVLVASALVCCPLAPLRADSCGPVEVVVYRIGDGEAEPSAGTNPVVLVKYSDEGSILTTYPLPTAPGDPQIYPLTATSSSTEGFVTRSTDGRFALLTGFGIGPGVPMVASTPSATIFRIVGRVDAAGTIDTSTALNDFADGSTPRGAASTNGDQLWVSGGAGGSRYAVRGATSSTLLAGSTLRQSAIFEGQLYVSDAGASGSIGAVGNGLPTTPGQGFSTLIGLPADGSLIGFVFFDLSPNVAGKDTLYTTSNAGLQKWTSNGSIWSLDGTVGTVGDVYRGIAATVELGVARLFATRLGTELVYLEDASGYDGTLTGSPTLLDSAPAMMAFRGVALAPLADPVGVHCDDFESEDFAGWSSSVP